MSRYRSHVVLTRDEFLLFKSALYLERAHGSYWRWRYSELRQKYDPNQPRIPAGQTGGGRWTDGDGAPGSDGRGRGERTAAESSRTITLPDGTHVRSEFDAARSDGTWDSRHTVTSPDGATTVFETTGRDQVVRDGASGQVLEHTTWTPDGPVEHPVAEQAVRGRLARGVFEAANRLYNALSAQPHTGIAVLDMRAREYAGDEDRGAIFVGIVSEAEAIRSCDPDGLVQGITNTAYAAALTEVGHSYPATLGSRTHKIAADLVRGEQNVNLVAEVSYVDEHPEPYGTRLSIRADILRNLGNGTVCNFDLKTGVAELSGPRMDRLAPLAEWHFPGTRRIIVREVRPRSPRSE